LPPRSPNLNAYHPIPGSSKFRLAR
jgi:hypothetical protein